MIKVLHVFNIMDRGGAEAMIMNLYRNINRDNIQFGFIVHQERVGEFEQEIKELGGEIYRVPEFNGKNIYQYKQSFSTILKEHSEYEIVHGHMQSTAAIYLSVAKKMGRITVAHSHNTSSGKGVKALIKDMLQYPIRYCADYLFACSKLAGEWLYGNKLVANNNVEIIYNAVDIELFRYKHEIRKKIREKEGFEHLTVIGHVGRFTYQKNHKFLIRVFKAYYQKNHDTILLLIGMGELENEIKELVKTLELEDNVRFLGVQDNVNEWMQAMDLFLFPSRYEGLPVTVVEAQVSGLPCIISDTITDEVILRDVKKLSLDNSLDEWVNIIECALNFNNERENGAEVINATGYNIKSAVKLLEQKYFTMINERK